MTRAERRVGVAGYVVFGSWCWVLYSFGAVLQLLRVEQGTGRAVTGVHSLGLAAGSVVSGLLADRLVRRFGRRRLLVAAFATAAVGLCALCVPLGPGWTVPAALVLGTGGAMTIVAWLPVPGTTYGDAAPAILARWLAGSAAVGIVAPIVVGAAAGAGYGWRPGLLVALLLFGAAVVLVLRVPTGTPALDVPAPPPEHALAGRGIPRPARRPAALVVTLIAIEFCCTAWVADLLAQRTGLSLAAAAAGVTAVLAGMTVSRAAVGRLALRHPPRLLLAGSLLLTAAGWAVAWLATAPAVGLAGLAVVGLGIGGQYPLGVGLVLDAAPGAEDRTVGLMSVGIGVSSGLGPFALGAVADARGTRDAFLVVPLLVAACGALLGVRGLRRAGPRAEDQRRDRPAATATSATTATPAATAPNGRPPPPAEAGAGEAAGAGAVGVRDPVGRDPVGAVEGVGAGTPDADSTERTDAGRSTRSTGSPAPSEDSRTDRPSRVRATPSP